MRLVILASVMLAVLATASVRRSVQNEYLDAFREECHKPVPGKTIDDLARALSKEHNDGRPLVFEQRHCPTGSAVLVAD